MNRAAPVSPLYHLAFRIAGLFIWLFFSLPVFDSSTRNGEPISGRQWIAWLVLFFLFAPAFWISSSSKPRALWVRITALFLQSACVLGMTSIYQGYLIGFLLVIVSWQIALILPLTAAVCWAVVNSGLWVFFQEPHYHLGWRWSATGAFFGFQVFAIVTAVISRHEAEGREEQARVNSELMSTRELLRESGKAGERIRIAREFHDIIGHNLTAICLHLEAAMHHPSDQARPILEKALGASKNLLQEARAVVEGLHDGERIDLRIAFKALQDSVPRIAMHIEIPDDLQIKDGASCHTILRCVQELTTNTLKHSDAGNLWVRIYLHQCAIEVEAHDDGSTSQDPKPGIGILAMRQRLEQLGGGLAIDTARPAGFRVKAWLPMNQRNEAL